MTKSPLRKQFLAERKALSAEEVERRSQAITDCWFRKLVIRMANRPRYIIHTFLPIARQNEINTWPIIRRIWREFPETKVVVSVTYAVSQTLTHYPLTAQTLLVENRWGIPEPIVNEQSPTIGSEQIDIVLVPLLTFDLNGHRVGYGGGYYDRFLAQCRPDCLKIGLSLFDPVEEIQDIDQTDVRLDGCVTPTSWHWFDEDSGMPYR